MVFRHHDVFSRMKHIVDGSGSSTTGTDNFFDISIPRNGTWRACTTDAGALKTGWAILDTDDFVDPVAILLPMTNEITFNLIKIRGLPREHTISGAPPSELPINGRNLLGYDRGVKRESQRRYSLDEYFMVEETSQIKNEYYDGQIFAMAGASLQHNRIARNVLNFLGPPLLNRGCEAFGSDLRVQTPGGLFTYPDVSVVRGEPRLIKGRPDTLTNPIVLVEVLSDATREYDRGQKFTLYKEIPAFREYMLVEQTGVFVETFRFSTAAWEQRSYDNLEAQAALESIGMTIPLREIYRLVTFDKRT